MTPAARHQAAIELLEELQESLRGEGAAFNAVFRRYFARRRYAGSGDRRSVRELVYGVLRDYQRLGWVLEQSAGLMPSPRHLLLARLALEGGDAANLFNGQPFAPAVLSEAEAKALPGLAELAGKAPPWVRLNCPEWLFPEFERRFGGRLEDELLALNGRAPLVFRANRLKGKRIELQALLEEEGIAATPGRFHPQALYVAQPFNAKGTKAYLDGLFEIQDEASQVAAALVLTETGAEVLDFCAGAGGKMLAMASDMLGQGQITATDTSGRRLAELRKRARRAGFEKYSAVTLPEPQDKEQRRQALAAFRGRFDRVLVDAPCSGTGTWRRQPELRLRYDVKRLEALLTAQQGLMEEAAGLVKPGGRMVYVTCSLLGCENEDQCGRFLGGHKGWKAVPWQEVWTAAGLGELPASQSSKPDYLQLSPAAHGTDGFFVSIFEAPDGLS